MAEKKNYICLYRRSLQKTVCVLANELPMAVWMDPGEAGRMFRNVLGRDDRAGKEGDAL